MLPTQQNAKRSATAATDDCVEQAAASLEVLEAQQEQLAELEFGAANAPRVRSHQITKVSVLIPVFNERWTIDTLLTRVLNAPVEQELELVVVDDCSQDGSAEVIAQFAEKDDRIKLIRHKRNRGKGAAIRTAIDHVTGDVAIIQDADLEYDPMEYPKLLRPILDGKADAVFGSRFAGEERLILHFWHSLVNKALTLFCNACNDLNLTDMETCYKVVRSDILKELRLKANTFTLEPEITTRLSQWGARIFEVPISYHCRKRCEGKKIRPLDGVKAIIAMLWYRFFDNRFTAHTGMYVLRSVEKAHRYNEWLIRQTKKYLGNRVVEAGAGIGNMSRYLTEREYLLLTDHDPIYVASLRDNFGARGNVEVLECDLTAPNFEETWHDHELDTVFCCNVVEHLGPDEEILRSFHKTLVNEGHCIIVVPAEPALYNGLDRALGHHRRYRKNELQELMQKVGFEVVESRQVCKVGALAWFITGRLLGRKELTPRQMLTFDRFWPLLSRFDRLLPWKGMSLVVVGKKTPC